MSDNVVDCGFVVRSCCELFKKELEEKKCGSLFLTVVMALRLQVCYKIGSSYIEPRWQRFEKFSRVDDDWSVGRYGPCKPVQPAKQVADFLRTTWKNPS